MIICVCRKISDGDLKNFAATAPNLQKCWIAVSTQMRGKPPVCNNGQGRCLEFGQNCLNALHENAPTADVK